MTTIIIDLAGLGLPPSANKRLHYMQRHKSNQEWKGWTRQLAIDAVNRAGVKDAPWDRAHVLYSFHYPRRTIVDLDNLVGSMKPCLDGLTGIVFVGDDARHVDRIEAAVEVVKGQSAGASITVTPCDCVVQSVSNT
jgi:hypothetical protein